MQRKATDGYIKENVRWGGSKDSEMRGANKVWGLCAILAVSNVSNKKFSRLLLWASRRLRSETQVGRKKREFGELCRIRRRGNSR